MSHRSLAMWIAIPTVLVLTACAGTASSDSEPAADPGVSDYLTELYDDAVAAGETDIIGYVPNPGAFEPMLDAFYGSFPDMNIELVSLFGPELDARLNAELNTGGIQADFTNVGVGELLMFRGHGWLEAFVPETTEGLDASYIGMDELWVTPQINVQGPIYNTTRIDAADAPSTWAELTSETYKGRVGNTPPTSAGGFPMATAEAMELGLIDEEWLADLRAQDPAYFQRAAENVQAVISGQIDLYTMGPYVTYFEPMKKGAPLAFGFLKEGNMAIPDPVALFKNSPNQAGAKLFVAWLFTDEAQALALEKTGRQGSMPGAPRIEGLGEVHVVQTDTLLEDYAAWRTTLERVLG